MTTFYDFCIESEQQDLLSQWAIDLNQGLTPREITVGSNKKVWWRCNRNHPYQCSTFERTKRGYGCPYCSGKSVLPGFNDLASHFPELASQWHEQRNGDLMPESVSRGSHTMVWWRCALGHEYQCSVTDRVSHNVGCPYCSGKKALPGYNDLATQRPDLAAQWHKTLNKNLTPEMVTPGGRHKVWWTCENGHDWQARIYSRTKEKGSSCPYCAGNKVIPGVNDFATLHPQLLIQWNYKRNKGISPHEISSGSYQKIWWICEKGHEWCSEVRNRSVGADCPICQNKAILPGVNDLSTTHPEIAAQWDYDKNTLTPDAVVAGSNNKAWWLCEKGHSYEAAIRSRTMLETKCPYCTSRRVQPGFNDLATVHPAIAAQWHKTLNEDLTPEQVTSGCKKRVWWECSEGHIWKAVVYSRTGPEKCGCPVCAGKINKKRAERYKAMLAEVGLEASPEDNYIPRNAIDL